MGAAITFASHVTEDKRFAPLARALGGRWMAIGALHEFWELAQKYWKEGQAIPRTAWEESCLPQALLDVGWAVVHQTGVYACGAKRHFAWILQRRVAGIRSGQVRRANSRKLQEFQAKEPGVFRAQTNGRSTGVEHCSSTYVLPSSSSQSNVVVGGRDTVAIAAVPELSKIPCERQQQLNEVGSIEEFKNSEQVASMMTQVPKVIQRDWLKAYEGAGAEWVTDEMRQAASYITAKGSGFSSVGSLVAFFGRWLARSWASRPKPCPPIWVLMPELMPQRERELREKAEREALLGPRIELANLPRESGYSSPVMAAAVGGVR